MVPWQMQLLSWLEATIVNGNFWPESYLQTDFRRKVSLDDVDGQGRCAVRLRHIPDAAWGARKYMNMRLLEEKDKDAIFPAS